MKQAGAAFKGKRALGPRSANVRAVLYLQARHLDALEEFAREQAREIGATRPDLSKAARSALDEWIAKRR